MNTQAQHDIDIQDTARQMVGAHVHANVGSMVEYIMKQEQRVVRDRMGIVPTHDERPFTYDDIENVYPDPSEWELERCEEWVADYASQHALEDMQLDYNMQEDYERDNYHDMLREYIRDNAQPAEILEWWMVSDWLCYQLKKQGEPVIDNSGLHIWGRTTSGQAIYMDGVIQTIATQHARYL